MARLTGLTARRRTMTKGLAMETDSGFVVWFFSVLQGLLVLGVLGGILLVAIM